MEEWYPKYGNLVPRDVATRAIFKVVYEYNLGIDGKPMVYLDLTHIDRKILDKKLEGILEIYEKFVGDDPRDTPDEDFPRHALHHGRAVDRLQADHQHRRESSPPASASISITERTGWERIRWCRASMAAASPGRMP